MWKCLNSIGINHYECFFLDQICFRKSVIHLFLSAHKQAIQIKSEQEKSADTFPLYINAVISLIKAWYFKNYV